MADKNQRKESFEELCTGYVLDALSTEERRRFEGLLQKADKSQKQFYDELQTAANQMVFSVEKAETPSPAVKQSLMEQIQPKKETDSNKTGFSRFAMAVAASFALLILTVTLLFYAFNLNEIIGQKEAQIVELEQEVEHREELLSILSARTVDLVVMAGLEVNPEGYGKIIWDPENEQALLQVSNLPPVPADKDYQLWLIKDNTPMPAGVFTVNETDEASFFKIEEMPEANRESANAFAVTLEPEGGVPEPTGPMYLSGNNE